MGATVTLHFGGGTAATNCVGFGIAGGCFVLGTDEGGLTAAVATGITNLTAYAGEIQVFTGLGARFDGTLAATIDWAADATPSLVLTNLAGGTPTVTWPTARRLVTQALTPGTPMVLAGIVGSGATA